MTRTALVAVAVLGAAVAPAAAFAAAAPNDNYLSSLTINRADGGLPREFTDAVDTSEAGTQPDMFNPNRDGLPFGGGQPEPTACPGGAAFGRTVWYDFALPVPGGVEMVASGFDAVVAVYEWDPETSELGRLVTCRNDSASTSEDVLLQPELRRDQNYTVQVGGVMGAGGPLDFHFTYFRDSDGDGVLDEQPDACRTVAGIPAFGGCPPTVRGVVRLTFDRVGSGIRLTSLVVDRTARGTRIVARCRRCGRRVKLTAHRGGTVRVRRFVGRVLPSGDRLELRITHPRAGSGRFRFGAIGRVISWQIRGQDLGRRVDRCTAPGSRKKIRCP